MGIDTRRKGQGVVQIAKKLLEARGARVQVAPLQAKWIGPGRAISVASDYFGLWDLIVVWQTQRRGFVQVTTEAHLSDRRKKILDTDFPVNTDDYIMGKYDGERAAFRVLRGPLFETKASEQWD